VTLHADGFAVLAWVIQALGHNILCPLFLNKFKNNKKKYPQITGKEKKMKYLIVLVSFLAVITSCDMNKEALSPQEVEKVILAKERQALDQWSAGNPAEFAVNFADGSTYFDDIAAQIRLDGIEEIKAYLNSLQGEIPTHTYEIVDPKVQVLDHAAVLTFQYHASVGEQKGQPWKATSVYQFLNNDWKVVHAHWSLVKE
jgi:hypothetical protein